MVLVKPQLVKPEPSSFRAFKIGVVGNRDKNLPLILDRLASHGFAGYGVLSSEEDFVGVDMKAFTVISTEKRQATNLSFWRFDGDSMFDIMIKDIMGDLDCLVLCYTSKDGYISLESRWLVDFRKMVNKVPVIVCELQENVGDTPVVPIKQMETWASSRGFHTTWACPTEVSQLYHLLCKQFNI